MGITKYTSCHDLLESCISPCRQGCRAGAHVTDVCNITFEGTIVYTNSLLLQWNFDQHTKTFSLKNMHLTILHDCTTRNEENFMKKWKASTTSYHLKTFCPLSKHQALSRGVPVGFISLTYNVKLPLPCNAFRVYPSDLWCLRLKWYDKLACLKYWNTFCQTEL